MQYRTEKKRRFQIEMLEQRIAPSAAGLSHALNSPGADHRSDNAAAPLETNLVIQSPPPPPPPPDTDPVEWMPS